MRKHINTVISSQDGFTLAIVLVISTLITGLVISLLVKVMFSNMIAIREINKRKLELACKSALELNKLDTLMVHGNTMTVMIDSQEVFLERIMKGLFWEVTASCEDKKSKATLKTVLGSYPAKMFLNALTVSKPRAQLVATGKTKINGDIEFPGDKISSGRILGIDNVDGDYHAGKLIGNENINAKIVDEKMITKIFNQDIFNYDTTIYADQFIFDMDVLENLVDKKNILITGEVVFKGSIINNKKYELNLSVEDKITFENSFFSNVNLSVHTDSSITFKESCDISNLIVISHDKIEVSDHSTFFNTQLFSMNEISVHGAYFKYPSLLLLYSNNEEDEIHNSILEVNSSTINGSVLLICETVGLPGNKSRINFNESKIHGVLYSENYLEISGSVIGSAYSYGLRYYKSPTEYINWMVNLNIDREKLDKSFLLPVCFLNNNEYELLCETWIY